MSYLKTNQGRLRLIERINKRKRNQTKLDNFNNDHYKLFTHDRNSDGSMNSVEIDGWDVKSQHMEQQNMIKHSTNNPLNTSMNANKRSINSNIWRNSNTEILAILGKNEKMNPMMKTQMHFNKNNLVSMYNGSQQWHNKDIMSPHEVEHEIIGYLKQQEEQRTKRTEDPPNTK